MALNTDALVLLPALLCDTRLFQHQVSALAGRLPVLVPDISGFDNFPEMAARLLDTLPGRFALAGNSMGGYLALEILRQAPSRVSHLALMGTNAHADPEEAREKRLQAIRLAKRGKFDQFVEGYVRAALHPVYREELGATMLEMARLLGPDVLIRHQKAILARADSRQMLGQINVPAIVICGAQDGLSSPETHQAMADAIPGATKTTVTECGHLVPLEAPEVVTGLLKELLAR